MKLTTPRFWETKKTSEFTPEEWEAVCTNCGHCCRLKLQDDETDDIYYTDIVCQYFDAETCRCREYQNRCTLVPECLKLTSENIGNISWIPQNCAYRCLYETGNLPDWHPLITGKPLSDKHSVKGKVISEVMVSEDDLEEHLTDEDFNHV